MKDNIYYELSEDLETFPDPWCYLIIGGRNTGKTYGALTHFLDEGETIVFIKRNNNDIDTLCAGNQLGKKAAEYEIDLSPYKPINRDRGTHIKAFKIKDGLGAFYKINEEGCASGSPIAYLVSLFAVSKIKGFDLSECCAIVFDEFIPQPWDRIQRKEGEQLMDLYKTVSRDRVERGKPELKLICLANAVNVYNPTMEILELTDQVTDMVSKDQEVFRDPDRGIFIRLLKTPEKMKKKEQETGLYKSMKDTNWGRMAFENEFGYNDFSRIKRTALKGFRPVCSLTYKVKTWYVYVNESGNYYMTASAAKCEKTYNLNTETGAKCFYYDYVIDLLNAAIEDRMYFEKYGMYDLIMNYKKRFII